MRDESMSVRIIGESHTGEYVGEDKAIKKLDEISKLPHVVGPCIALPDLNFKDKMECPSSAAVATKDHIIPHLSSTSQNCGMGALVTQMEYSDKLVDKLPDIYDHVRSRRDDPFYQISIDETLNVLQRGPKALCDRFDLDEEATVKGFEFGGNLFDNDDLPGLSDVEKVIPDGVLNHPLYSGRDKLGMGIGGNHFLEIQQVTEILDENEAAKHNINKLGQIVVMYHGGGGILPGIIGAYFSKRKLGYDTGLKNDILRLLYHVDRQGISSIPSLYKYYLSDKRYTSFPLADSAGKRLAFANNVAMNYGFGYRLFFFLRMQHALHDILGLPKEEIQILKDKSHNSILNESIEGEDLYVHRHNTCRIVKDELTLLPGFYDTSSYLCVGLENTEKSLHSAPHGAGDVIKATKATGLSKPTGKSGTLVFKGTSSTPEMSPHYSDEGLELVATAMEKENITRPIVKLSPISVLKKFT